MGVRQQIVRSAPVVKAVLGVFGVPGPLVDAVGLVGEVAGFSPSQAAMVRGFAERAADALETYSSRQYLMSWWGRPTRTLWSSR